MFHQFLVVSHETGNQTIKNSKHTLMSHLMTKPTKWHVRPAKTQISLGIRPVWSESSLSAQLVSKDPSFLHADSEDSDQLTDWADLSLRWAHMPFCWFCHVAVHLFYCISSALTGPLRLNFNARLTPHVQQPGRNAANINPHLPSRPVHPYQLDESISNFRGVWFSFSFLFYFE